VSAYQPESHRYWQQQLGPDHFSNGHFGENLTAEGLTGTTSHAATAPNTAQERQRQNQPFCAAQPPQTNLGPPALATSSARSSVLKVPADR
jgi:hypothetical protein